LILQFDPAHNANEYNARVMWGRRQPRQIESRQRQRVAREIWLLSLRNVVRVSLPDH